MDLLASSREFYPLLLGLMALSTLAVPLVGADGTVPEAKCNMPHQHQTRSGQPFAARLFRAASNVIPFPRAASALPPRLMERPAAQATAAMRIVLVEWRIEKGREDEFLEYWSGRATVPDRSGLIGEFLSRVEDRAEYPWMVWELDEHWTTFVNVGLWREGADFQEQIGRFIDDTRPAMAFEAAQRRRVFVAPERWRTGGTALPVSEHNHVL